MTFAAGLAKGGMRPVLALYSTFSQRVFDQMFHDIAIQGLPVTLCLDRAGIVEGDGITHQGIFDVAEFSAIPGINIYSPDSYDELERTVRASVKSGSADVIRYPKGREREYDRSRFADFKDHCAATVGDGEPRLTAVTYGRLTAALLEAASIASEETGESVRVVRLKKIAPLDPDMMVSTLAGADRIYVADEGINTAASGKRSQHSPRSAAPAQRSESARSPSPCFTGRCPISLKSTALPRRLWRKI